MNLCVNGENTSVTGVATVSDLLCALDVRGHVAVEINREIIPRGSFDDRRLSENDKIEIITAIGGG